MHLTCQFAASLGLKTYLIVHILVLLLEGVHFVGEGRKLSLFLQAALFRRLSVLHKPEKEDEIRFWVI